MTDRADAPPDRHTQTDILVGSRVADARRRAALSVSEIAARLAMEEEAYRRAENGRQRFSPEQLVACSRITGVDLAWFFAPPIAKANEDEGAVAHEGKPRKSAEVIYLPPGPRSSKG